MPDERTSRKQQGLTNAPIFKLCLSDECKSPPRWSLIEDLCNAAFPVIGIFQTLMLVLFGVQKQLIRDTISAFPIHTEICKGKIVPVHN